MKEGEDWELFSYVDRGKLRRETIRALSKPKTPRQLSKELACALSEASRVLLDLSRKGVAECLTPDAPKGRVYRLTKKGYILRDRMLES